VVEKTLANIAWPVVVAEVHHFGGTLLSVLSVIRTAIFFQDRTWMSSEVRLDRGSSAGTLAATRSEFDVLKFVSLSRAR